ncbi:MAG: SurA N-terminal domain-containing protein [Bacteroidales bacterium]|nr:SurA N-terminal domain-containing protein [Bacteroidales bacterium]
MPAIQKIRKHGALLICIIGAALFAFIAEEAVRSMETTSNASKQQIGEVFGQALNYQEFQEMVNNETEIAKMRMGGQNLSDAMMDQLRDQVWGEYVNYQLIKHEADGLGLIVTDAEVQEALKEGTAQSLINTLPMFAQGGRFDYVALKQFLEGYKKNKASMQGEQMEQYELAHRLWEYAESKLRRELLMNKYQSLFATTLLSNPVNAKRNFADATQFKTATVAALPFAAMKDKVNVTDEELKAAYEQYKENFFMPFETRDIKYIDVAVTASAADKKALEAEMQEIYTKLSNGEDAATVIGGSKSLVRFANMPLSAKAFPGDVAQHLDSMAVGQVKQYTNSQDNTMNVIKLISKTATADSILYRSIAVQAEDEAKMTARYDSVMNALNGGADFKAVAKNLGQPGDSTWVTSAMLDAGSSQPDNVKFAQALYAGGTQTVEINGIKIILKIEETKGTSAKYVAAVAKCDIAFSKETYNAAKNKMNMFMSKNSDLAAVEKAAAKEGYQLTDSPSFMAASHNIGAQGRMPGIPGTKDAVKWVFDDAKVGQISKMYECGEANDHLLLVGLAAVHEKGYLPWDNADVKKFLTAIVTSKKQAEAAAKKYAGIKTLEAAAAQGAVTDTIKNASFLQPLAISATKASEPKVAAALAVTKKGAVSPLIIGSAGAYIFRVEEEGTVEGAKFDEKTGVQNDARMYAQWAQGAFNFLYKKAKVIDNRYKF